MSYADLHVQELQRGARRDAFAVGFYLGALVGSAISFLLIWFVW